MKKCGVKYVKLKKGDTLPDAKVFIFDGSSKETSIKQIVGEERVIIFGLPGAFTPTCSAKHLPGFISAADQLKAKDIKKIICVSVNDPFVMDAWGKTHNVENKILMVGDSNDGIIFKTRSKLFFFTFINICTLDSISK